MRRPGRSLTAFFLVLVAASVSAQSRPATGPQKWAVVIAVGKYQDPQIPALPYAAADARAVHRFLVDPKGGGYSPQNVEILIDDRATKVALVSALATRLAQRAIRGDTVFIYYAGHGAPESDPSEPDGYSKYLVPHDAIASDLFASAINMADIEKFFTRLKAETIILALDTCYSGAGGGRGFGLLPEGRRSQKLGSDFLHRIAQGKGRAILAAADTNEVALEVPQLGHGLFTYYLLEGLKGGADANRRGYVTLDDTYQYLYERVARHSRQLGGNQNPKLMRQQVGEIILAGERPTTPRPPRPVIREDVPVGSLMISSSADGAEVFLGENRIGKTSTGRAIAVENLATGTYRLRVKIPGQPDWEREVQIVANGRVDVLVAVEAARAMPTTPPQPAASALATSAPGQLPAASSGTDTEPPKIVINYPPPDLKVEQEQIGITGSITDNVAVASVQITVNGKPSPSTRDIAALGRTVPFNAAITLQPGVNVIAVTALDRAGNARQEVRTVTRSVPTFVTQAAAPPTGEHLAVIIGVGSHDHPSIPRLKYTERDAKAVYDFLVTKGGFKQDNVEMLTDSTSLKPTLLNMKRVLSERLARKAGEKDTVLIYYAGHGAPEVDTAGIEADGLSKYLIPRDAHPESLFTTAFPMDDVQRVFARLRADRVVLMLDTCFSGGGGGRTFTQQLTRAGNLSDQFLDRLTRSKGRVILSASGPNEVALELPAPIAHGLFTYYLLEGMSGKADRDGDGVVTVNELYEYVAKQVPDHARRLGGRQRPIMKGQVEGAFPLIRLKRP